MARCTVRTFGGLEVVLDGAPVATFTARSAEAVLVYVAVADGPVPREVLARMLWPDRPDDVARANLRSALHRLRRVLPDHLDVRRGAIAAVGVETDARALEARLRRGALRDAVALYRGDFLDGFAVPESPSFEAWQAAEAERYRGLVVGALEELVTTALATGVLDEALAHGRHLLRIDPLHEPIHRALARALAHDGRRGAALDQLDTCVAAVRAEHGLEPDPETLRLAAAIREGAGDVEADAPMLATGASDPDLPTFATPFVGRAAELRLIERRLTGPECRWLTILGTGGIGKTRLAIEAGRSLARAFRDGVRFVDLSGVQDVGYVVPAVATALGLDALPPGEPERHVAAYLRGKRLLLVLDDLERLVDAAPTLAAILRQAPAVRVLATSRARLHLTEEWLLPLDGLGDDGDAATLFETHALRAGGAPRDPEGAEAVREICALVENHPLALELAATWTNALPLTRIAASLREDPMHLRAPRPEGPERHRSLNAAVDASWTLLPEPLRPSLARLAVFRGGFGADAAARVALATESQLLALVDRSLVRAHGDGRFSLHEVVRQFALGRLRTRADVEATSRRHLHWCRDLARTVGDQVLGRDLEHGLATMKPDVGNVRAALAWGLEREADAETALELIEAMVPYWRLTSAVDEARAWVLRAEPWLVRFPARAGAIRSARGHYAWMAGAFDEAEEVLGGAIDLWDRSEDAGRVGRATALISFGMTAWARRRLDLAEERFDAALAELEGLEAPWWRATALGWRGRTAVGTGDLERARRDLDASLDLFGELDNPWGTGMFASATAEMHVALGELAEARRLAEVAVALLERVGFKHALGSLNTLLASIAARAGDPVAARERAERAAAAFEEFGDATSAAAVLARYPR
jgi:predicted ATPase/DNA-binding SARP family transcriptional activator